MITTVGEKMKEFGIHRRDSLIITTIDIIDDLGIQGLSTREIAKRENISEATLFRHYKNKNDLLIAVLDYYAKFDEDLFHSVKLMELNACEAIRFYISATIEYYENYPALTSILQLFDALRYEKDLEGKVLEILSRRFKFMMELITQAKADGLLSQDTKEEQLVDVISGILLGVSLHWRSTGRKFSLKQYTISALDIVLKANFKQKVLMV